MVTSTLVTMMLGALSLPPLPGPGSQVPREALAPLLQQLWDVPRLQNRWIYLQKASLGLGLLVPGTDEKKLRPQHGTRLGQSLLHGVALTVGF